MKQLKKFFQGILIGLSCLIPGFSGGTMALILGIYEDFMASLALITKHFKEAFLKLWSIGLGILVGAFLGIFTIVKCLNNWPLITSGFFVGLVLATIPMSYKNARKEKGKLSSYLSFLICAIISILLIFADKFGLVLDLSKANVFVIIYILLITSLSAAAMLIPAASGSLILLMFGIFEPAVVSIEISLKALLKGDWGAFANNLYILIPFIIGIIIGIIAVGKIITYLLKKCENQVWYSILALLVVSVFAIIYNAFHDPLHPTDTARYDNIMNHLVLNIIGAIVMAIIGFLLIYFLQKMVEKRNKEKELVLIDKTIEQEKDV